VGDGEGLVSEAEGDEKVKVGEVEGGVGIVDVPHAAPQAHRIVNVALHQE
jgi:hypothetical protein